MGLFSTKQQMVEASEALPDREHPIIPSRPHLVLATSLVEPFPEGSEQSVFGLGCFWGAERRFWELPGVVVTAVGYAGGFTANPTYEDVCSGRTGHAEVVLVVSDPEQVRYEDLVRVFYESHDPTQGMRQGNDLGTQYRSAIYSTSVEQAEIAERVTEAYSGALAERGLGPVTTERRPAGAFYYAEDYHQQYLAANPNGYCGLGGTGVSCPVGLFGDR